MAGDMSADNEPPTAPQVLAPASTAEVEPRTRGVSNPRRLRRMQRYGTVVVVGGGCYASYYVRQLRRAALAGSVTWERLVAVDRGAECAVATSDELRAPAGDSPGATIEIAEWQDFFARWLPGAADDDAIVPSPLMPHLMVEWLMARVVERWPGRTVSLQPLPRAVATPWQRAGEGGVHYVSFAEWMCPINCIEPARCPHTKGARTWSMPPTLEAYVADDRARGGSLDGPLLFHCEHRSHGVGMFDAGVVRRADRRVQLAAEQGAAEFLVGTVSHCHGALARLVIGG